MTRGGKRVGAGAPVKEVTRAITVNLRFTPAELVVIDSLAESKKMNRCKFIRYCIDAQIALIS